MASILAQGMIWNTTVSAAPGALARLTRTPAIVNTRIATMAATVQGTRRDDGDETVAGRVAGVRGCSRRIDGSTGTGAGGSIRIIGSTAGLGSISVTASNRSM